MAKQIIVQSDTFGEGFTKTNENFTELYTGANTNITVERIPFKDTSAFDDSPLYYDVSENKIVSDVAIEVPAGTIKIGETVDLSSCTGTLIVDDNINSKLKYIIESEFDSTGSELPTYLNLGIESVLNVQTDFSQTLTANPLTYSIIGTVVAPSVRQINTTTFKTGAILTNLRARFIDNITGIVMKYIPSKAAWDANTGITTVSGDNLFNFLSNAADTPGVFNLGINPFIVENGQQIDIEIEADSINILGDLSGDPYQLADIQDGPYVSLADAGSVAPGGSDKYVQLNDGGTFGGEINFQFNKATDSLILKSDAANDVALEFVNSSDASKGMIVYDESTDEFYIDSTNEIIRIGSNVFIHSGAADGRIDIEATTVAGTAELTLSDVGGGTGLMINYDDATDHSYISGEKGPLTISTATDEEIRLELGGSTAKVSILNATSPDTNEIIIFTTGGTNSGTARIYVGSRTPEGNVTANGGSLYIRDDGTNSDLYLKRSDGGNTEWVDLIHSESGVKGPASSTDNAFVLWDGTTGGIIKDSPITFESTATLNAINVFSPSATGESAYFLDNSSGDLRGIFEYKETTGLVRILATSSDLELQTTGDLNISTTGSTESVTIDGSNLPDTLNLLVLDTGGTNGGVIGLHVGARNPEGLITADGGALYFRDAGVNSDLYIKRTDGGNTGWTDFLHSVSGVQSSGSSTDNAIVLWDGTTGLLVKDSPVTIESSASNTVIYIESPSVTGKAEIILTDSVGDARTIFEYIESSGLSRILATDSDLDIVTNGDMIIQVQGSTKSLTIDGSNSPDTQELLSLDTGGANGAVVDLYVGTRNPEGNITALDGALYFRKDGVASNIFRHESIGSSASGWVPLVGGDNGGSTDKSIPIWNGTDSDSLSNEPNARIQQTGGIFKLELEAPIANDTVRFELLDSSSVSASFWQFNDNTKLTLMLSELGDLEVGSQNHDAIVSVNSATSEIKLAGFILPDTQHLLKLSTGGANGADANIFVGTRNPNENITGVPGDHYLRTNGIDSAEYIQTDSGSSTAWSKIMVDSDTNAFGGFGRYQNLLTYSEDMTDVIWTQPASRVTLTGDNALAPNGETTADTVEWTAVGLGFRHDVTTVDTSVYTLSFWAQSISGNNTIRFDLGDGPVLDIDIDTNTLRRYSVQLTSGATNHLDITVQSTLGTFVFWGWNLSLGTDVLPYAKTEAFALTTADYGLSIAGNLRTDFAEIVSEASGTQNTFRVKTGTFGSYIVLSDGSNFDNVTIECYEDGAQSNISLDALTKSEIRSSSAAFEIKSNANSVDLITGGNDTNPPITIEAQGTNGALTQFFSSIRNPVGNVTGEPGDMFFNKNAVLSGFYQHYGASANNTDWFKASVKPPYAIDILSAAALDDIATANVITLSASTTYIIYGAIVTGVRFALTNNATVKFQSGDFTSTMVYTGTGDFISGQGGIRTEAVDLVAISTGTLLNISNTTSSANFRNTFFVGWDDLGAVNNCGLLNVVGNSFVDIGIGFSVSNTPIGISQLQNVAVVITVGPALFDILAMESTDVVQATDIVGATFTGSSLFRINPAINSTISIQSANMPDGSLFNTSGGTTGTFTAVADASVPAEAITSVTDSGGIARFNFAAPPTLFVDQEVVISTFVTNTAYNGTFIITATGANYFEVSSIAFGSDETGSFLSNSITLTDTTTTLVDGDTLKLDTDLSIEYDGGATVYNQLTNSFQVNRTFAATETGTWDTSGIDQSDPRILAINNRGFSDSRTIGFVQMNGNVLIGSSTLNTYKILTLTNAIQDPSTERFKLTDIDRGTLTYTGLEPVSGNIVATISALKSGSTENYRFAVSINSAQPVFATAFYAPGELKTVKVQTTLLAEVQLFTGDTVEVYAAGDGTGNNFTTTDYQFQIIG